MELVVSITTSFVPEKGRVPEMTVTLLLKLNPAMAPIDPLLVGSKRPVHIRIMSDNYEPNCDE